MKEEAVRPGKGTAGPLFTSLRADLSSLSLSQSQKLAVPSNWFLGMHLQKVSYPQAIPKGGTAIGRMDALTWLLPLLEVSLPSKPSPNPRPLGRRRSACPPTRSGRNRPPVARSAGRSPELVPSRFVPRAFPGGGGARAELYRCCGPVTRTAISSAAATNWRKGYCCCYASRFPGRCSWCAGNGACPNMGRAIVLMTTCCGSAGSWWSFTAGETGEQVFRDQKSRRYGWSLRDTQVGSAERFDRLLLIGVVAYVLLVGLGYYALEHYHPRTWFSSGSCEAMRAFGGGPGGVGPGACLSGSGVLGLDFSPNPNFPLLGDVSPW